MFLLMIKELFQVTCMKEEKNSRILFRTVLFFTWVIFFSVLLRNIYEGLLLFLEDSDIAPYNEPNESSSPYFRSILILSFSLRLDLPSGLFIADFQTNILTFTSSFLPSLPCPLHAPSVSFLYLLTKHIQSISVCLPK
jgi:hypothetical protein